MTSLENMSIQCIREKLLEASFSDIMTIFDEASLLPCGAKRNESQMSMREEIQHDCLAYMIVNIALTKMDVVLYGGFISNHLSGLPSTDVDISFLETSSMMYFKENLISILLFATGFKQGQIRWHNIDKTAYSYKYMVLFSLNDNVNISIVLDLTMRSQQKRKLAHDRQYPITLGRHIGYAKNGNFHFTYMYDDNEPVYDFSARQVCNLLKEGRDVAYFHSRITHVLWRNNIACTNDECTQCKKYLRYYIPRLDKMRRMGYKIENEDFMNEVLEKMRKLANASGSES